MSTCNWVGLGNTGISIDCVQKSPRTLFGCYSWLFLLVKYMYLIGVWLGEDQRTNTMKRHMFT